jgi:colicin import membrane protein
MPRRLTTRPERRPPTFDLAKAACEAHFRETGLTPTTEAIVERIGVQNRPLIRRAIEDWLLDLPARLYHREGVPDLPPAVAESCRALWESAVQAAGTAFVAERVEFQATLAAREAALAEAQAVQATLKAEREWAEAVRAETDAAVAALRAERAEERRRRETAEAALSRSQADLARLQAERDAEQRQAAERLAFLEARLEKEHTWALQRITEERDTAEKTTRREIGRRDQELGQLKLDLARVEAGARGLREELATLRGRAEALAQALTTAEAARDEQTRALTEALETLAELRATDRLRQAELEEFRRTRDAGPPARRQPRGASGIAREAPPTPPRKVPRD